MKWRWLMCGVVLLSLTLALPAGTQAPAYSLLTNGDFEDEDMSAWLWHDGALARTTATVHSGNGAGALTMEYVGETLASYQGHYVQCIDISDMTDWPAPSGIRYLTVNGWLMSDGVAQVRIWTVFYPNNGCTGDWLDSYRTYAVTSSEWTLASVHNPSGGDIRVPDGTNSVRIYFMGQSPAPGIVYVDDLAAFSSTVNAVQSQGVVARSGLWAVGLVGVAAVGVVLGRRRRTS